MKFFNTLFNSFKALGLVLVLLPSLASGQTLLGPSGGFEGSSFTVDNATVATTGASNKWQKANATQTLTLEGTTTRTGSQSLKINNSSTTGRRVFTPLFTPSAASGVRLVIQYYRYSTANTNTQQNQNMISFNGTAAGESTSGTYSAVTTPSTWEKVTYVPTTTSSATSLWAGILNRANGTSPYADMFIDDFCVYEATAVDNTAASSPSSAAAYVSNTSITTLNISWTAASGGVDGGGYIVVRGTVDPNTTPTANGIYAIGNSIGTGSVVYVGTSTNFADILLTTETQYFYRIYTFDKAYNYSAAATTSGIPTTVKAINSSNWSSNSTWNSNTAPITATNVTIPTGITVNLDVNATINDLTFTGGGKLTLGANTLTISGNATGGSTNGWVITDGIGTLKAFNFAGEKTFPVGTATAYAPVKVDNSAASRDFSVKVGTTFSGSPAVPTKMVQLEWNVTPSNLVGNNAALTFQWPLASENGAFARGSAIEIAHFNGTIWDAFKLATLGGSDPYTATASGFTTFSPFTVGNQNALSVDLLTIAAQSKGTKNLIAWSTASEKNNAYFEVQHATNGLDFQSISDKIKGNGTTNVKNDYAFDHLTPSVIRDYYRLKQVDFDGTTTLSKVVSVVATGKNGALKVYPTLATDKLNISLESKETVDFNIYNVVGQSVQSGQLTGQKELIINHLPSGAYFLKVGNATVTFSKN